MDIQGFEYAALCGMKQILQKNQLLTVLMELWPYGLNLAGTTTSAVVDLFRENNFHLYLIFRKKIVDFSEHMLDRKEASYYSLLATKKPVKQKTL
jgi:hypothetical protein